MRSLSRFEAARDPAASPRLSQDTGIIAKFDAKCPTPCVRHLAPTFHSSCGGFLWMHPVCRVESFVVVRRIGSVVENSVDPYDTIDYAIVDGIREALR